MSSVKSAPATLVCIVSFHQCYYYNFFSSSFSDSAFSSSPSPSSQAHPALFIIVLYSTIKKTHFSTPPPPTHSKVPLYFAFFPFLSSCQSHFLPISFRRSMLQPLSALCLWLHVSLPLFLFIALIFSLQSVSLSRFPCLSSHWCCCLVFILSQFSELHSSYF